LIFISLKCDGCGKIYSSREFTNDTVGELLGVFESEDNGRHLCIECSMDMSNNSRSLWEDVNIEGKSIRLCGASSFNEMALVCSDSIFEFGNDNSHICLNYKTENIDDTEYGICRFAENNDDKK